VNTDVVNTDVVNTDVVNTDVVNTDVDWHKIGKTLSNLHEIVVNNGNDLNDKYKNLNNLDQLANLLKQTEKKEVITTVENLFRESREKLAEIPVKDLFDEGQRREFQNYLLGLAHHGRNLETEAKAQNLLDKVDTERIIRNQLQELLDEIVLNGEARTVLEREGVKIPTKLSNAINNYVTMQTEMVNQSVVVQNPNNNNNSSSSSFDNIFTSDYSKITSKFVEKNPKNLLQRAEITSKSDLEEIEFEGIMETECSAEEVEKFNLVKNQQQSTNVDNLEFNYDDPNSIAVNNNPEPTIDPIRVAVNNNPEPTIDPIRVAVNNNPEPTIDPIRVAVDAYNRSPVHSEGEFERIQNMILENHNKQQEMAKESLKEAKRLYNETNNFIEQHLGDIKQMAIQIKNQIKDNNNNNGEELLHFIEYTEKIINGLNPSRVGSLDKFTVIISNDENGYQSFFTRVGKLYDLVLSGKIKAWELGFQDFLLLAQPDVTNEKIISRIIYETGANLNSEGVRILVDLLSQSF
jgi:hypothetical protein